MPRLDAHQHFWRYNPVEYPWIGDNLDVLRRDFMPADLRPLLNGLGFNGSIAVQARQTLEETEWLLGLAEKHDFIKGVVGWLDLRSARVPEQLEKYGRHPKLVGARHVVQDEPEDDFVLRADFRAGIAQLAEFGLAYDLLVFPRQLPSALRLAMDFPGQRFVLDHVAKPSIRSGEITTWAKDLRALAQAPNVHCKLSGLVTEAVWKGWKPEDFRPYLDVAVEAFGTRRLMIGSDWPVCTVAGDYGSTMGMVIDYLRQFPDGVREEILGGNCARFYGITEDGKTRGRK
jgi:L-fuconolactonase